MPKKRVDNGREREEQLQHFESRAQKKGEINECSGAAADDEDELFE